ncbi:site-specific integrase [Polynucleobacter paneuropaeus]|nr:site-specific integrase [Polynucleobacter paneuropaeus]MBT8616226.1 site-specific integrase [Polynucleobacter paneuropaeus]MBT8618107.1 site-specific integrase [Polynucleobacter paneuropaeus]MBT8620388.1 site-specific integrase [Polynucleobacter paneuropaeus]MBT8625523.1 site-specific integrase [Polynucleobacter paneuropaeus]
MPQAKSFSSAELTQVLIYVKTTKHNVRNRAMLLLTHWAGLRVGEVAALRMCDVLDANLTVKSEIRLAPEQTKGGHARTVFVNQKLRAELQCYADTLKNRDLQWAFFPTQKFPRRGFTANTLTQHMNAIYRQCQIEGATSHSGRRSFITNLASKGIGVRVLMSLAGHKHISTTQAYIDVNDDMKRRAVELI